ncbi:MAG: hypothetical protein NTZ78_08590 [Candidatus Aureabacteria bacterium]|nr:hypothetical protein [Candidatus Auribacterota bacterium]
MAVLCPRCGRQYDITLFQFGRTIRCECGTLIDESHVSLFRDLDRILGNLDDARKVDELKRMADEVCRMILDERLPDVDVEIAQNRVREKCRELFPDKLELFEMIYESRFKRLWEQFRNKG